MSRVAYYRAYRQANRERINAKSRARHARNRARIREQRRKYRQDPEVHERILAQARAYYHANLDAMRAKSLKRYQANRDKMRAQMLTRYHATKKRRDPVAIAQRLLAKADALAKQNTYGFQQIGNYNP